MFEENLRCVCELAHAFRCVAPSVLGGRQLTAAVPTYHLAATGDKSEEVSGLAYKNHAAT